MGGTFSLIHKGETYKRFSSTHGDVIVTQLFMGHDLEVLEYRYMEGFYYLVTPASDSGIKTYQVQSGQVEIVVTGKIVNIGEMVVLTSGDEDLHISVSEGSRLLVHAYQANAFASTMTRLAAADDVMDRIQQKDNYTKEHNYRVREMMRSVAIHMGFSGNRLRNLLNAARFHDVGKINVPDSILNKPGSLTPREYEIVKGHVLDSRDLIWMEHREEILAIIVLHHERLDGSGYPYGLKGEEISKEGRLLAVLDVFDAMTTDRIYKPGKSVDDAIEELYSLADVHFDRQVLDVLGDVLKEKGRLRK